VRTFCSSSGAQAGKLAEKERDRQTIDPGPRDEPGLRGHGAIGLAAEIAAEVAQAAQSLPGVNVLLNQARKRLGPRLKNTALERFLAGAMGSRFVLELRAKTSQEIGDELLCDLADALREGLPTNLGRAVRAVLFFDTFEAVSAGLSNDEQRLLEDLWKDSQAMQSRVNALETILDDEVPDWRKKL